MRWGAVLGVVTMGCTAAQARTTHRAGEVVLPAGLFGILGSIVAAEVVPTHRDDLARLGLGFVPVSLVGALLYVATDSTVSAAAEPVVTARDRAHATAWQLATDAKHAARRQDCAEVQAIEPRVRALDEAVYRRFLRDEIIRRCLGPPPEP